MAMRIAWRASSVVVSRSECRTCTASQLHPPRNVTHKKQDTSPDHAWVCWRSSTARAPNDVVYHPALTHLPFSSSDSILARWDFVMGFELLPWTREAVDVVAVGSHYAVADCTGEELLMADLLELSG